VDRPGPRYFDGNFQANFRQVPFSGPFFALRHVVARAMDALQRGPAAREAFAQKVVWERPRTANTRCQPQRIVVGHAKSATVSPPSEVFLGTGRQLPFFATIVTIVNFSQSLGKRLPITPERDVRFRAAGSRLR
jgi:hypothetical protein